LQEYRIAHSEQIWYFIGNTHHRNTDERTLMSSITVVGSINTDLVIHTPRLPALGESVIGSGFMTAPGGKGANQAVAAARLGAAVSMVGCVGDDTFGRQRRGSLAENGVNVDYVYTDADKPTGTAMITVKDGDNLIVVDPGANFCLTPAMVEAAEAAIRDSSVLLVQLEVPYEAVTKAIRLAKKYGVRVLLNPAPARELDNDTYKMIDILTPNEIECAFLTGIPVGNAGQAFAAAVRLLEKGVASVAVTLGENGTVYTDGGGIAHTPAFPVEAVDTTAAGDTFSAALAVALCEGKGFGEAVTFANAAAALAVTKKGAQTSLPFRNEVETMLRAL